MTPRPPTNLARLAVLLLIPVGATATLAFTLARDTSSLRAQSTALQAQRTALQARLDTLTQRRSALERELAQATATAPVSAAPPAAAAPTPPPADVPAALAAIRAGLASGTLHSAPPARPREPSGPQGNVYFAQLLADPHYADLFLTERRFRDNVRYARLYATLGAHLSPGEIERLKATLAQRDMTEQEVEGIAIEQALQEKRPRDVGLIARLKLATRQQFDAELQTFGAPVQAELMRYANELGARQELLERLELRLSYSGDPLTADQTRQIVSRYEEALRAAGRERTPGPLTPMRRRDQLIAVTEEILRPAQRSALEEIRAEIDASVVPGTSGSSQIRIATPPAK